MKTKYNLIISNKNLGIEILRAILCFWVLLFHCLNVKYAQKNIFFYFAKFKLYHVPCFTFIAFYFSFNIFKNLNLIKIKSRFERLLIPYLVYPIAIWIINNLIYLAFSFNRFNRIITFYELFIQLILGYQFSINLWFLLSTIIITMIFTLLVYTLNTYFFYVLQIVGIIFIIFQYSKPLNFFYNYPNNIKIPLNHIISQIPLSIAGITYAFSDIISNLKNKENLLFISFIHFLLIFVFFKYNIFKTMNEYKGIEKIFLSFLLFTGFYLLPLNNFNYKIKLAIKLITNFTQGIYCLHPIIKYYVHSFLDKNETFSGSILIYLISYIISFLAMKIFGKTKLKYLFV